MIILISGTTHSGKTFLSKRLIGKLGFPCLSIDHLKMGLIRSGQTGLTPEDDRELTSYLFPIVREMIKTAIENGQDMIIEGCYVPFDFRREFENLYAREIRFICLTFSDGYIDENYEKITGFSCAVEKRLHDPGITSEFLKAENRYYEEGFRRAGEKVFVIENDFLSGIEEIMGSF